jgi:hypothetical protein
MIEMVDILSWDKSIDEDVKTSDDKKVGKVRAVTTDFIQIQKGTLDKKYYFVPKHYIQGYDGDDIWLALTEDEVKQFESEKEMSLSSFDNAQYRERKSVVEKQYPQFSSAIPTYSSKGPAQNQVGMSWDKVIGEEVKSADDKDLGKVESIAADYVEVKEGTVNKKHYYIPKSFVEEFDGKKLHVSLTKDEVKERYERDSPPLPAEFESNEYKDISRQREAKYPQYLELIPLMAKEPGLEMKGQESGEILKIPWEEVIHKHVRTSDNVDIGDVDKVGNEFIVVREGIVSVHLYYIPKQYINHYDGSSLWVNVPSGLMSAKFERKTEPTQQEIDMLVKAAENKKMNEQ